MLSKHSSVLFERSATELKLRLIPANLLGVVDGTLAQSEDGTDAVGAGLLTFSSLGGSERTSKNL